MATLTGSDYKWMADFIQRNPIYYNELKLWGISKNQLKNALQAIETWEVGGHVTPPTESRRTAIQGETGSATLNQETTLWLTWASWKQEHTTVGS